MHEYKFYGIENDDNPGRNTKQIKTHNTVVKLPEIVHIPTQIVRVNPKVELTPNTSEKCKGMKLWSGKQIDELPKKIVIGDTITRIIHIDDLNHAQDVGERKDQ